MVYEIIFSFIIIYSVLDRMPEDEWFVNRTLAAVTYFLAPWSRVLEKLTGFQLVKKFPAFYGTRRFITAFTSARHPSLF